MAKGKSKWGVGLVSAYGLFVLGILAMVYISMSQKVDLVSEKYYDQGLRYEDRIKALENSRGLKEGMKIDRDTSGLVVRFPRQVRFSDITGKITLYRPDNKLRDASVDIALDTASCQRISSAGLAQGLWRVQVAWEANGIKFYTEEPVVIQ